MSSKQAPIHSGFGPTTTARETLDGIDLRDKVAIVTGGYSGIGLETTRALAEAGATVIVPARTPDKARQALSGIPRVEQSTLDLLDPGSIDGFANEFLATGRSLHMLINNAGIMATPLTREGGDFKTLEQGAATSVWCATSLQLAGMGGVYCQDVEIAEVRQLDSTSNDGVSPWAIDPKAAERLWILSEELTGMKFDP
jgi:NAD(P)-dependent dehydrogenase (short-subunit alcohol dehydrogenase family)